MKHFEELGPFDDHTAEELREMYNELFYEYEDIKSDLKHLRYLYKELDELNDSLFESYEEISNKLYG